MLKKVFICLLLANGLNVQAAQAQTDCQTIDRVLESIAVVRDIQVSPDDRQLSKNIDKLSGLVDKISLADLVPQKSADSSPEQVEAIFTYFAQLRAAIASAQSGYEGYAKQTLQSAVTPGLSNSLQSHSLYVSCLQGPEQAGADEARQQQAKADDGQPLSSARTITPTLSSADVRPSNQSRRAIIKSSRNGGQFGTRLDLGGNTFVFVMLMSLIALVGIFYYVPKRAKKFQEREVRIPLNKPAKFRLNNIEHVMTIIDISMNGAKIQHAGDIELKNKLKIEVAGTWYDGQVQWSNQHYVGVRFNTPFNRRTLKSVVRKFSNGTAS